VAKVLTFGDPVGDYIVLTTAKKSTRAQNKVRKINGEHRSQGRTFQVRLLTWDDIERLIDASPAARQFLGLEADDGTVRAIKSQVGPLENMLRLQLVDGKHGELDEAKAASQLRSVDWPSKRAISLRASSLRAHADARRTSGVVRE
jgi:hypothetical protein